MKKNIKVLMCACIMSMSFSGSVLASEAIHAEKKPANIEQESQEQKPVEGQEKDTKQKSTERKKHNKKQKCKHPKKEKSGVEGNQKPEDNKKPEDNTENKEKAS